MGLCCYGIERAPCLFLVEPSARTSVILSEFTALFVLCYDFISCCIITRIMGQGAVAYSAHAINSPFPPVSRREVLQPD